MKALGGRLVTSQVELPSDIDGILTAVRTILKMGNVQSLRMALGEPITYERVYSEEDGHPFDTSKSMVGLSISEMVRQRPVEESPYNATENLPGAAHLMSAFMYMAAKEYVVTHLVVSPGTKLWKWLKLDPIMTARISSFLGAKLELDKTLSPDKVLLCGASTKTATIDEIEFSLVVHMEVA